MTHVLYTRVLALGLLLALLTPSAAIANEAPARHLTAYGAVYSPNRMIELLGIRPERPRLHGSSWLAAVALSQAYAVTAEHLVWEVEGQLVQHGGRQNHTEINALVVARWTRFPWDDLLDTSVAFGQGVSFATKVPEVEPRADRDEESRRLLNYLMVEVALAPPGDSRWSAVTRIHHRSGVFGLYGGVNGGSNFVGLGVRYRY
jgi:hypothetical protein